MLVALNWWHKRVSPYVLNSTGTYFQHAGFKMRDILNTIIFEGKECI